MGEGEAVPPVSPQRSSSHGARRARAPVAEHGPCGRRATQQYRRATRASFMRLGIYSDLVYRSDGRTISTDDPFTIFIAELARTLDRVVLFGRLHPAPGRSYYLLPRDYIKFAAVPYYPRLTAIGPLLRSLRRASAVLAAELDRLDGLWLFGPHPASLVFARVAASRSIPIVLGVREDFPLYVRNRLPRAAWPLALPLAHGLEHAFRRLAARAPAIVVGEELARRYRGGRAPLLSTSFSLIRASHLVALEEALARPWNDDVRVLTVGRLEAEKNPLLLPAVLAALRRRHAGWRLAIAGDGPLTPALERKAAALGVSDAIEVLGYVRNGPDLWAQYRASSAFLHVGLTEGVPQVLFEAQGMGLPVVATDVGGVREALAGGEAGLLVPPNDADAAAAALERLRTDEALRSRLIAHGLENAASATLESQTGAITSFLKRHLVQIRGDGA